MQLEHDPQRACSARVISCPDHLSCPLHIICQQHPCLDHVEKDGGVGVNIDSAEGGRELGLGLREEARSERLRSFEDVCMVRIGCECVRDVNGPKSERTLQGRQDVCALDTKPIEIQEKAEFSGIRSNDR